MPSNDPDGVPSGATAVYACLVDLLALCFIIGALAVLVAGR